MTDRRTAPVFPGPEALGRGAVIGPGQSVPAGLAGARQVTVDDDVLAHPDATVEVLHRDWVARRPVVIELAVDNSELREPQTCDLAPYELPDRFAFQLDRLHFLTWANAYDCRGDEPIWWHGVLAWRAGAGPGVDTDAVLADGTAVWCDGGPRGPVPGLDGQALLHRESIAERRLVPLGTDPPREDLAPDQLAAVAHDSGPARIIAPAGSGKTRVLTARLRHLLRDRRYEPELVTAVAYNTRAAAEMRARTADLSVRANIRTLHSLGLWICNLDRRREVIDERQTRSILDRLLTTAKIPNQDPFKPYLEGLAEVRLGLRDPDDVEAERDDVPGLTELVDDYRHELDRRNALDFDEQIYRAIELLLTRPDIRATAQRRCTHLLVDEFQDLTPAFLMLIRLVASPALQIFGVGDDDQVVYGYSGASPRYLVDFDRWFPGAEHLALEVNYRCPPQVVEAVSTLLGHNRLRVDKKIRAGSGLSADG